MPGTKLRLTALGAAVLVLAGACGSSAQPKGAAAPAATSTTTGVSLPAASAQPISWHPCSGGEGPSGYQCASISVRRDPQDPSKGTIQMALDRRPASGAKIGSLVLNPGGPGASGVDALPELVASMPASLLDRFDVVGFDPPGVARTAPIVCLSSAGLERYYHVDPDPVTKEGVQAILSADRSFADGCEAHSGAELPYVSTVDAAMDMDVLRRDLGERRLTYMGFSYGTLLGATYANLFPGKVRAMVLDGALDPALGVIPELDQQAASLDGQLRQFFSWCTRTGCSWKPPGDPEAAYQALLARVRTQPLPVPGTSRTVGPAELLYGTAATLYSTATWPDLAQALQQASQGNGTDLLHFFDAYTGRRPDGSYSNIFEANAAVNCLDAPAPSIPQIESAAPAAEAVAPVFGLSNLYSELTCSLWPVRPTGKVGPLHAAGAPPIVVVGSTGDPITPYRWAQALAGELDSGVLLTRVGDGHTGYRASSCIRDYVDRYLTDLTPPPKGTRCPSD